MFSSALLPAAVRATARRCGTLTLLTLATVSIRPAQAQTAAPVDTTFQRLLQKNQFSLTANGTKLSGPGWDKLAQDIRKSTLVLVGEDHGMAQIPQFTQAVAEVLKPRVFVAEIDQYQARDLSRLAAEPGLPTAFSRQYPMTLSFYSWQEEFELAQALRAQKTAILGIDQVNLFYSGRLLETLAGQVKNKPVRAALQLQAAAVRASDRQFMTTMQGAPSIYLRPTAADSLRKLVSHEKPAVRQMVEDYLASAAIYQASSAGQAGSHATRINLMKRNLLANLQPYNQTGQPLPPMLFKFGAYHLGRGRSIWGDMYDVGNLASSLADAHDQKSLHICIMGRQGQKVRGFNPDDFSKNPAPYSNATEEMVLPFMAATPAGSAWQVFDMRPLRRAILRQTVKVDSQELEATILGYDYVVIIPETTASHNF